jgi:hypothetical protein
MYNIHIFSQQQIVITIMSMNYQVYSEVYASGYNEPLSRGVRLFNLFINCYDKENLISVDT